jgi:hypothetical protein
VRGDVKSLTGHGRKQDPRRSLRRDSAVIPYYTHIRFWRVGLGYGYPGCLALGRGMAGWMDGCGSMGLGLGCVRGGFEWHGDNIT